MVLTAPGRLSALLKGLLGSMGRRVGCPIVAWRLAVKKKPILIALAVLNVLVLMGQIAPQYAPPFAQFVNLVFLIASLVWFVSEIRRS